MNKDTRIFQAIQLAITDQNFISRHKRNPTAFTRKRKLSFATIVVTILKLIRKSLQITCNLLGDTLMQQPVSKQSFSEARYKISYTGFKELNTILLNENYRNDSTGLWFGYRVFGTDGSTARLPNSQELEEYFGRPNCNNEPSGKKPIKARISEIVELTTGITVNGEIAPFSFGERRLAVQQTTEVAHFFQNIGQSKQLFVFDRGYISWDFIVHLLNLNVDFMFRVPKKFNKIIDKLVQEGHKDGMITLYPDSSPLRLVVKKLASGEQCVLLCSIKDDAISGDDLSTLYWYRWRGCEEGYKKQKISLELENFSGKGFEVIMQEFYATLVTMNMVQVQCLEEEGPWDPLNPPEKRINRNVIFGSLRESTMLTMLGQLSIEEHTEKFRSIARRSWVKIRPGRAYSREDVGKPKRYHVFRRIC